MGGRGNWEQDEEAAAVGRRGSSQRGRWTDLRGAEVEGWRGERRAGAATYQDREPGRLGLGLGDTHSIGAGGGRDEFHVLPVSQTCPVCCFAHRNLIHSTVLKPFMGVWGHISKGIGEKKSL